MLTVACSHQVRCLGISFVPRLGSQERANLVGYLLAGIVDGSLDKLVVDMPEDLPGADQEVGIFANRGCKANSAMTRMGVCFSETIFSEFR